MDSIALLLQRFTEQVYEKKHVLHLAQGWEKKVGVEVEDRNQRYCLQFHKEGVALTTYPDKEQVDLRLCGKEDDLLLLFGGEALPFLHAKALIHAAGTVRDRLKLDTLIRLAHAGSVRR